TPPGPGDALRLGLQCGRVCRPGRSFGGTESGWEHLVPRRHRRGQNPFQLGGSFVFGPGNVDRFAHLSATFGDNASPADLLAAVLR
ncbi:MAG TPA: hypothetical protein VJB36_03805, partial [Methylomirabilota bacterium]|nr:hypothetical protein [Methylomirabilota bacterium]